MDYKTQVNLFIAMLRANLLGYGGGPPTIPLIHKEVVLTYKWMDEDDFSDLVALTNTLPGPLITKLVGYIGYRVGGVIGMLNALFAAVAPTVILMIILIGTIASFSEAPVVQGMTAAIAPVVGVLLAAMTYNFLKQSNKSLGFWATFFLTVLSLFIFELLDLHPALLIITLLLIAIFRKPKEEKESNREGA